MLRKIISIKNVGRFRNSAAPGNPELLPYTLIVGANGLGKTTLCAVFRSLNSGNPSHITGRRTLGIEELPTVDLLLSNGQARFDGTSWTTRHSPLAIFDSEFIAENVHAGEVVNITQRRNLYHVIIGAEGVRLAEEDTRLSGESRSKTREITATAGMILPRVPAGMTIESFLAQPADPEIAARIAEQQGTVSAVRQAELIKQRPAISEIAIPSLEGKFLELLRRTIDDIAKDAEARLNAHLAMHGMEAEDGIWIARGLKHANRDTCPFCGQDMSGVSLIAVYQSVFSEKYKALRNEIAALRSQIVEEFGDGAVGKLNTSAEKIMRAAEYWSGFCTFAPADLTLSNDVPKAMRDLREAALALLDRKALEPLEPIHPDQAFDTAARQYADAVVNVDSLNGLIGEVNNLIATKKEETGAANVRAAEMELSRRQAIGARHSEPLLKSCANYDELKRAKASLELRKSKVRTSLNAHAIRAMRPYETRINYYLDAFNSGFRITETKHGFPGGTAASSYQLVINNTAIELGDSSTPRVLPSFKNTLSSGDRTTLALAFFLAHLEQREDLSDSTVVFDDPFSSQDAFRRRQTIHEIAKLGQKCSQVIILSHDAIFLEQIWDKAPAAKRVALTLADHRQQGTKILPVDIESACRGRTATDIDDLLTFLNTGAGASLDVIRKMRTVLESYCWLTYPNSFKAGLDWLGEIVRKIREGGKQHASYCLYNELVQINDYTKEHHHGEDVTTAAPQLIDAQELTGYVRRTLRIVNALQA